FLFQDRAIRAGGRNAAGAAQADNESHAADLNGFGVGHGSDLTNGLHVGNDIMLGFISGLRPDGLMTGAANQAEENTEQDRPYPVAVVHDTVLAAQALPNRLVGRPRGIGL